MKKYIIKSTIMIWVMVFGFALNAQVNLTNGLVFHLPLDNNTQDVSTNNNNGTGQNLLVAQNRYGSKMKAVKFDGAVNNGLISMGSPMMNVLTDYSISYWFRIDQNTNGMSLIGQDNSLEMGFYTGPNRVIVFHPTFGSFSFAVTNASSWNHVVITGVNSAINCYLNGNLVRTESGNYTAVSTSQNFNIGGNVVNQSNNSWLRGAIDDVRLYDRVITADEIDALYNVNSVQITVDNIDELNPCAGQSIQVDFSTTGNILPGNEYVLEISDLDGNYVDNIEIGKIQSDALSGSISGVIPEGMPSGTNFTVRVSSTNVMSAGSPSSQTLSIQGVIGDIPDPALFKFVGESNGRMYYRSLANATYTMALNNCVNNGGHLANVGDQDDQNLLYSYVASSSAWIALNDDDNTGTLSWANDFTTAYSIWQPGQPGSNDNVVMRVDNGRWNGLSAGQSRDYFLQLAPAGLNVSECDGGDITFAPGSLAGASYTWTGPNGFTSSVETPSIIGASTPDAGTYNLTIDFNGCSSSNWTTELTIDALSSNKTVETSTPFICEGSTGIIYVLDTESAYEYSLHEQSSTNQIGTSQSGNGDTLFFSTDPLSSTSNFEIRAIDPLTGCQRWMDDVITINIWSLPGAPTTTNDNICNGGPLNLSASGGGINDIYNWYSNAGLTDTLQSGASANYQTDSLGVTTTFYVTIIDQNGCESPVQTVQAEVINPLAPEIDLTTGLLVHYTYEGNTLDQSGNNINASISGSNSSYVDDRFQNPNAALNLNGSTYTTSGNPTQVGALTNQVTISMWIKQTPSNWGFQTPLLNKWQNNGLYVGLDSYLAAPNQPNENRVRWRVNNGTVVNSNTNVPHNQWHHIVCTYNGAQLRIYQNGVLTGQANHSGTITNTITNLEFGRLANGFGSVFYRGDVDDVRLYNRALSLEEAQALFNGSVAFSNSPICEGDDLELTSPTFTGASYSWTGPNGFTSSDQNPSPIVGVDSLTHAGIYALEVTRYGCTSLPQEVDVTIHPTPQITSVENDTVCGPNDVTLTAFTNNQNATFQWYTVPSGGTPIAGQSNDELNLTNINQTETRYVSVVLNGCESQRVPVSGIYYDQIDPDLNLTGVASICEGEDVDMTIINAEQDVAYEVLIGGTPTGVSAIGNNADLDITVPENLLSIGNNTIQISASTPGCSSVTLNNQLTVEVEAAPQVTITSNTGNGEVCNGQTIDLTASSGDSYLWNTGEVSPTITVGIANNYTVTVTYANGCESESVPFSVQEITVSTPTITALGNTSFCEGEDVVLEASGGTNYEWSTGATTPTIQVTTSGNYAVNSIEGSCQETSAPITITVYDLPTTDEISGSAIVNCESVSETYSVTNTAGSSYLWTVPGGANIVSGQGTNEITVNFNGNFGMVTVIETNADGCEGEEKLMEVDCNLNVDQWSEFTPKIYPNPANKVFNIEIMHEEANLKLYDASGKIVIECIFSQNKTIDISYLETGIYYGVVEYNESSAYRFKIIKIDD